MGFPTHLVSAPLSRLSRRASFFFAPAPPPPPPPRAEIIAAKGAEHTTVEELVKDITPKGRATVPEAVKGDVLEKIRTFLKKN